MPVTYQATVPPKCKPPFRRYVHRARNGHNASNVLYLPAYGQTVFEATSVSEKREPSAAQPGTAFGQPRAPRADRG